MNTALWAAQVVFALAFGAIAALKFISYRAYLDAFPIPLALVFALGAVELLASFGLIAPALARSLAWAPAPAALLLLASALLALIVHLVRAEYALVPINAVLIAGAAFIAWGRWHELR